MSIKKIIAGTVAFSLVLGSVCYYNRNIPNIGIISNAEESTDYTEGICGSMTYKKYSDHIEISNCSVSATDVVIPDRLYGLPVTVINNDAFMWCSISSITIPKNVAIIGNMAFYGCKYLESILIENPECLLGYDFVPTYTVIYGYDDSTAHEYANKYQEKEFYAIDTTTITTTNTITTTTVTTTIPTTSSNTTPKTTTPLTTTTSHYTTTRTTTTYYTYTYSATTLRTTTTTPKAPTILPKTMDIRVNENKELTILNCSNPEEIQWISSNDEVAVVEEGKVVGLSKGSATIYAVVGNLYGEINVDVSDEIPSGDETIKGDINGDNKIDAVDASALLSYYAYTSSGGKLPLESFLNLK